MLAVIEGITDEHLQEVYSDPYICRIGHDHRPASPISHPNVSYLTATVNGRFAGAFMVIRFSSLELELHSLLKRSFVKHSRELGRAFLAWAFSKPIQRVTAYIIEGMETARNYCLKLGFKDEGCRRQACMQNGVLKNVYILGMVREEWRSQ